MSTRVFVATESGLADVDGVPTQFTAGITRVAEGHALHKACPNHFKPVDEDLTFPVESTTSSPRGSRRGPAAKKAAGGANNDE